MSNGRILSLDPSSTCVGYSLATFDERLLDAGLIRPKQVSAPPMDRIESMLMDVHDLLWESRPTVVLIEIPGGKVHGRIQGKGHGLTTYGFAVGRIYEAVVRIAPEARAEAHVIGIPESDWTGGTPKADRAAATKAKWRTLDIASDRGLDAADAAGMLLWFLQRRRNIAANLVLK